MTNIFRTLPQSEKQLDDMGELRDLYTEFYEKINALIPDGRYKALANANLETSGMYAIKSIAFDE